MGIIFFGMATLLGTMALVMGGPLLHYMKRDRKWLTDPKRSMESWYH